MSGRQSVIDSFIYFLSDFTDNDLQIVNKNISEIKRYIQNTVYDQDQNTGNFFTPLSDKEIFTQYPNLADYTNIWRQLAIDMDHSGPIAWRVKAGFTFKTPINNLGYYKFNPIQNWSLQDNPPTKNSIVFWIPRLLKDSTRKSITQMEAQRAKFRQDYGLPEHHCLSFGSVNLHFGLIYAHFKRTSERIPFKLYYAMSDTPNTDGVRICTGHFDDNGLRCCQWLDENGYQDIGFFPIGIEEIE